MNLLVVGGGMSGWITALYLNKVYPEYDVSLLESKKINTIGVGEGTTPHFIEFLNLIGIPLKDFMSNVNSTIKQGINFKDFNQNKDNYYHDFNILGSNKAHALHFDSSQVLDYFTKYALSKNINHIIDEVENHNLDKYYLIFDCTGLNRSLLKQSWVDCSNNLPFNSAIPFTIEELIPKNRTISTAKDKGWIWQIPLNGRTGCGYVFNSNLNTKSEIISDIKDLYSECNIKNQINFNPGYNKDVWVDNIISVGLSSGFFEPIEATSLMTTILQLYELPKNLDKTKRESYNKKVNSINEQVFLFIRYHYVCDRTDGVWGLVDNIFPFPEKLKKITRNKRLNTLNKKDFNNIISPSKDIIFTLEQYELLSLCNFNRNINSLI